ncbi:MAG: DUF3169 family protein [Eubacteriales bacterium]|nr:DUF3169 family protein [Eubacteriales bacterium]
MKTKKMNSYKKLGFIMLVSAVAGGILGMIGAIAIGFGGKSIEHGMAVMLTQLQQIMLPIMVGLTVISVVYGEWNLRKERELCQRVRETEDEECDRWEYLEEKNGAWGMIANVLSQVLCILVLSLGYSAKYIGEGNHKGFLAVCIVFLVCFGYDGFWQMRYIRTVQKAYPEKKGDPASRKFYQEWLNSCDEAEREMIYQSAYKSYIRINKCIPILLVVAMLGHLYFNTGLMAIIMVSVIWLIVMVSYLRSCVKMKGARLRE